MSVKLRLPYVTGRIHAYGPLQAWVSFKNNTETLLKKSRLLAKVSSPLSVVDVSSILIYDISAEEMYRRVWI